MDYYKNVNIIGTGTYHPSKKVDNEYYIQHFKKSGVDITDFLDKFGRKERYIIDNDSENALTMAVEASKKALESAGITPDQLDAIVFSSDTPEYLCPTNSMMMNNQLGAVNAHVVYDMNANCLGMLEAIDQISRYMKTSKKIKYALVAGGLFESIVADTDSKYIYPVTGDGGAAVVLQCIEEPESRGVLDSSYCVKSEYCNYILSPTCGYSKSILSSTPEKERKHSWVPFRLDFFVQEWCKAIKGFQEDYEFPLEEIEYFFMSQYSKQYIVETAAALNIQNYEARFPYVGDQYGYTGTTSPIFALHEVFQHGTINKGSKAVFCSVGAGSSMGSLLYKF